MLTFSISCSIDGSSVCISDCFKQTFVVVLRLLVAFSSILIQPSALAAPLFGGFSFAGKSGSSSLNPQPKEGR